METFQQFSVPVVLCIQSGIKTRVKWSASQARIDGRVAD